MLELGEGSAREHMRVADQLIRAGVERAVLVGPQMRLTYEELLRRGWTDTHVIHLDHPKRGSEILRQWLVMGDVVLVKGSQGMRMEIMVEGILAQPERATELLCRQSKAWKDTPFA